MKLFGRTFVIEKIKPTLVLPNLVVLRERLNINQRFPLIVSRASLAFGGLLLAGGVSGANWGISYVQSEFVPKIAEWLGQTLDRPIQLGAVEQVSWTGIRLGRSVIPATATDADRLTVEALEIHFNPIHALKNQQLNLSITLVKPVAYFDQDAAGDWLNVAMVMDEDEQIQVQQIRLQDATITLAPRPVTLKRKKTVDPHKPWDISDRPTQMTLRQVNADLHLQDQAQRLRFDLTARAEAEGKLHLNGDIRFKTDQVQLAAQTQALALPSLMPFVPTDIKLDGGSLDADLKLQIQPHQPPSLIGTAQLQAGALRTKGEPNRFTGLNGRFQFQGQQVQLQQGQLRFGQIPFQLAGKIDLLRGFDLNAKVEVEAAPFMQTLKLKVPFPVTGVLKADNLHLGGAIDQPVLAGTAYAATPVKFDRVDLKAVEGKFRLDLAADHLWIERIQAQPAIGGSIQTQVEAWLEEDNAKVNVAVKDVSADQFGQLYQLKLPHYPLGMIQAQAQVAVVHNQPNLTAQWQLDQGHYPAQGKVILADDTLRLQETVAKIGDGRLNAQAQLQQGRWHASVAGTQIPLGQLQPQLSGRLQGQLQLAGQLEDLAQSLQGTGQAVVQMEQGKIAANLTANQGRWQTQISGTRVPLEQIAARLSGQLDGDVRLSGRLDQLSLPATRAEGKVRLSQGLAFLTTPVSANFAWDGRSLQLQQAITDHGTIQGWITPAIEQDRITKIAAVDLNVDVQDYDLATLPMAQTLPIAVTGRVDLKGNVTGSPDAPQVDSRIQVRGLAVQKFQFEPMLQGQIQTRPNRQLRLDLQGKQDQIAVTLDSTYRPADFSIRLQQTKAVGQLFGNRLVAQIRNFALDQLNLAPVAGWGPVRGVLAADLEANLADLSQPSASALVDITNPGLGMINAAATARHRSDRFTGRVNYHKGAVSLSAGSLQVGESCFQLSGQVTNAAAWNSQIAVEQGKLQDLLSTLPAEQLTALLQQLSGTSDQADRAALPAGLSLPTPAEMATLDGAFSGDATLQSSAQGMAAQVNLQGQNWQLSNYGIRQIAIRNAQFANQTLTLPAVQAEGFTVDLADQPHPLDARLSFAGQVSSRSVAGQLQLDEVALPQIQSALKLPVELRGKLNAVAELSGTPAEPSLAGTLHLSSVSVRDMNIEAAKVGFSYLKHQFHLESWQPLADAQTHPATSESGAASAD